MKNEEVKPAIDEINEEWLQYIKLLKYLLKVLVSRFFFLLLQREIAK